MNADDCSQMKTGRKWIPLAPACDGLRVVAFDMAGGVQVEEVADWVSSVASSRLVTLVLEFGDKDTTSVVPLDRITPLDGPLCGLARRVHVTTGKRLTLVLLAKNPSGLVERLPQFHRAGNVWKGERVIDEKSGRDHFWTYLAATESKCKKPDESVLDCIKA